MPNNEEMLEELYNSVRMLLRHCISARHGVGISEENLKEQMKKLDKLRGKEWAEPKKEYQPPTRKRWQK